METDKGAGTVVDAVDRSESMRKALPKAVQCVLDELKKIGVEAVPASNTENAELWWEVNPAK